MASIKDFGTLIGLGAVYRAPSIFRGIGAAGGVGVLLNTIDKLKKQEFNDFLSGGNLTFPNDLESARYYVSLKFEKYQRRSIFDTFTTTAIGGIRLPLPGSGSMVDSQSVSYEQVSNKDSPVIGAAIEGYLSGGGNAKLSAQSAAAAKAVAVGIGQTNNILGNNAGEQVLQLGGLAQNPFLTVLFNAPNFKRHRLSWRLAPNNLQETQTLRNIITKIRYHMLPDLAPGSAGSLLTYPDMCMIQFHPDDSYLYKFKPCVVESFSVNYAPGQNPAMFWRSDAPSEITFSIDFLEIEYWLKKDINV